MDNSEAGAFTGYLTGMTTMVNTRRYIDAVLSYASSELTADFGRDMDAHAAHYPDNFHHVYEWGNEYRKPGERSETIGNPTKRLWQVVPVGRGRTRVVGFTFLPSTEPSPIHTSLLTPGGKKKQYVKPDVHVFTWKAPIMEYGTTVTIEPQLSPKKMLAFVDDKTGKLKFTTETIETVPGKGRPGSGGNIGMFSGYFLKWWSTEAMTKFDNYIRPRLENDLADESAIAGAIGKHKKAKAATIGINRGAAERAGRAKAQKDFGKKQAQYLAEAAKRRLQKYGY